jgi:cephalosporin hydroxylase
MADDQKQFLTDRAYRTRRYRDDVALKEVSSAFFNRTIDAQYSYNFDWLGVPIIQYPQDIVAMQEIVWRVKPDLVIETGVARGGSIIFYASMMKLLGNGGKVLGVDIDIRDHNRQAIESHPLADCVSLIRGSSVAPEIVAQVGEYVKAARNPLVVLDSNHTHEHVLRELEAYSGFVKAGSYVVVFDTCIDILPPQSIIDRPWRKGDSPMSAVDAFLAENDRFKIDLDVDDKIQISVAPRGYLKCVRD